MPSVNLARDCPPISASPVPTTDQSLLVSGWGGQSYPIHPMVATEPAFTASTSSFIFNISFVMFSILSVTLVVIPGTYVATWLAVSTLPIDIAACVSSCPFSPVAGSYSSNWVSLDLFNEVFIASSSVNFEFIDSNDCLANCSSSCSESVNSLSFWIFSNSEMVRSYSIFLSLYDWVSLLKRFRLASFRVTASIPSKFPILSG